MSRPIFSSNGGGREQVVGKWITMVMNSARQFNHTSRVVDVTVHEAVEQCIIVARASSLGLHPSSVNY